MPSALFKTIRVPEALMPVGRRQRLPWGTSGNGASCTYTYICKLCGGLVHTSQPVKNFGTVINTMPKVTKAPMIWQAYWSSPIVAIVAIGTVAIADAGGTGGNVIYIIAIGTIVATADAGGPHQGQCGFRRPSIALFVPRNDKSSIYSDMSSILKQSRAGAIVAIVAISTIIAIADAGGPYQGQCGCWRPSIAISVARNNKIPGVVIVAIVAIVAIADAGGTGGDIIIILDWPMHSRGMC
ncbi:hypothetical protein GGX14DRAFT_389633 [Mycena pura]|uniref:Uncharacterized protein n=1 Tax=Mycena pura TaxID=153505 RepID=A0AAD6VS29_9AGAR|nr:hypothetical protein GGX14DRAFT_389633 [Mycena pura]